MLLVQDVQRIGVKIKTKSRIVTETSDGWTLAGASGNLSAQYEHTMIITRGEPLREARLAALRPRIEHRPIPGGHNVVQVAPPRG